ncbi:MAG: FG-GAP-like repeat-containing protein [Thermodesulfobacteriota bacterium]
MLNAFLRVGFSLFVVSILVLGHRSAQCEENLVLFFPTDTSRAAEYSYLGNSIGSMMASRLSVKAGTKSFFVGDVAAGDENQYYQVKSSLVKVAQDVELLVEINHPAGAGEIGVFRVGTGNGNDIFQAIEELVTDIAEAFFGLKPVPGKTEEKPEEKPVASFQTPHPERQLKKNAGMAMTISSSGEETEAKIENEAPVRSTGLYRSPVIPLNMKAFTAGDLDGDSNMEIAIASHSTVAVYRMIDGQFQHLINIPLPANLRVHALNLADLDNNGIDEFYLSATSDDSPASFIFEFSEGQGVTWQYRNIGWYVRPMVVPGKGMIVAGQRNGLDELVTPGVFHLYRGSEGITVGDRLPLPDSVNLFNFIYTDLDGDGSEEVVAVNSQDQLEVYSTALELLHTSAEGFCGSVKFFGLSKFELEEMKEFEKADRDQIYLPIRLQSADFDRDGRKELVVARNELYSTSFLPGSKSYRNGFVEALSWNGQGFSQTWSTNKKGTGVADVQFRLTSAGGQNNRTQGRLFVVRIEKDVLFQAIMAGVGGSRVSLYEMEFNETKGGPAQPHQ